MSFLPDEVYALIEESVPLLCVDFFPMRVDADGSASVGLILRDSPFGEVWCHLGGRVRRGESIRQALQRHALETVGTGIRIASDQPDYVYQWFPPELAPLDGTVHGNDPRKHSVGLTFVTALESDPSPRNEAKDFRFFPVSGLPTPMWPGSADLLRRLTQVA